MPTRKKPLQVHRLKRTQEAPQARTLNFSKVSHHHPHLRIRTQGPPPTPFINDPSRGHPLTKAKRH